jgi:hypothetical protein
VSVTSRASIPDLQLAACSRASTQVLRFDSLHDKLTQLPPELGAQQEGQLEGQQARARPGLAAAPPLGQLQHIAQYLRRALGLALFGFDVVVCACTAELQVIDVNYFPNYRGDGEAGPLLRRYLRAAWQQQQQRRRTLWPWPCTDWGQVEGPGAVRG